MEAGMKRIVWVALFAVMLGACASNDDSTADVTDDTAAEQESAGAAQEGTDSSSDTKAGGEAGTGEAGSGGSGEFSLKTSSLDDLLSAESSELFGVAAPLSASASTSVARAEAAKASDVIDLAEGLSAEFLTREAGSDADMFAYWPNEDAPTHLVFCIEGDRAEIPEDGSGRYNPSIQTIDIASGEVVTRVRGMQSCDGIRLTPWNTILATEETDDGGAYEILDPMALNDVTVTDRGAGTIEGAADNMVKRSALPTMSWEGLTITDEGVIYAGDELRPGEMEPDSDGGSMFKFIPDRAAAGPIDSLDASPLTAGKNYAFQADCYELDNEDAPKFGQGCEIGNGVWLEVGATTARTDADAAGATGYYRPEDLHADPTYSGPGVRFCWTNTGREDASNFGEVICGVDAEPMSAGSTLTVNRFIEGDPEFNSVDNLAFQPATGILYVIEDHEFGDIWACLPDGDDRNIKSDGCIRVASVKDESAEPTGFAFNAAGDAAYVSIQHSDDEGMDAVDDYGTDDILVITGFTTG